MRLRGYDGVPPPPALICCRPSATARCRNDDAPNGRGEGSGGRSEGGDPSWGGAGTCEKPRGLGLRACECWIVEQAVELSLKKGKAEKKFSFDEFIRNCYSRKSRGKVLRSPRFKL